MVVLAASDGCIIGVFEVFVKDDALRECAMHWPLRALVLAALLMGALSVSVFAQASHEGARWQVAQRDGGKDSEVSQQRRERIRQQIDEQRQRSERSGEGDERRSRRLSEEDRERLRQQVHEVRERRESRKQRQREAEARSER